MEIISFKVFKGRNIYSHKKCIRLNLDLEGYSEIPNNEIFDFNNRLINILPELAEHICGIDDNERGFNKTHVEGTYLAHVCQHIILELHNMIGVKVSYGKAKGVFRDNCYVIYQYQFVDAGIEAANIAVDLINSLIHRSPLDINSRLIKLREILISEQDKVIVDVQRNMKVVAITGTNGKTTTTRLITHILSIAGYVVGMTTTSGIYINGKCICKGDMSGPKSALVVLTNKNINAAVLETARGGIIREGLAYDLSDVAVITNITEDHIGIDEVKTIEDLAKVKALVGEAVKTDGYVVINGDDKISISILQRFKSKLIIFSMDKNNEIMQVNIKNGGYGIYIDEDYMIVQKNTNVKKLISINNVGITMSGLLKFNIENAMAACGAAIGLGIDYDIIEQGLMSFYNDDNQNPGRFNKYFVNDVMVILDYGHNIASYKAVFSVLKNIEHNKLIGVIGAPGDRLDSFILEVGKYAGENLDFIFIKDNEDKRGRAKGEVADIIEKGVLKSNFHSTNIKKISVESEAFKAALDFAKPKDIIIIFIENPKPFIDIMREKIQLRELKG
ncbi:cyanophycin synthetase family protein [Clostridium sp.]|uniref:cyanophycin synthetase family protein n=1 Tax=Clostridium sp. TaxID=1506 RepID=UPI003D6D3B6C